MKLHTLYRAFMATGAVAVLTLAQDAASEWRLAAAALSVFCFYMAFGDD